MISARILEKNEKVGENYFMLSKEGERIYLQKVAEEKDLGVIERKDIKWTELCFRVIGRASGVIIKLIVSFKYEC